MATRSEYWLHGNATECFVLAKAVAAEATSIPVKIALHYLHPSTSVCATAQ
jgi:hypothetical protein